MQTGEKNRLFPGPSQKVFFFSFLIKLAKETFFLFALKKSTKEGLRNQVLFTHTRLHWADENVRNTSRTTLAFCDLHNEKQRE